MEMRGLWALRSPRGARKKSRRVGRGHGSGRVKTAGRGTKGQGSRSGGNINPRFEGGQLPIVKRLPHRRGFTSRRPPNPQPVNLRQLARFESGDEVGPEQMAQFGLVKHAGKPIKILADGDLAGTTLIVKATAFSAEAKRKIEAAGGMAEVLN